MQKSNDRKTDKISKCVENSSKSYLPFYMMIESKLFSLTNIKFIPYAMFHNDVPILNADFFGKENYIQKSYYKFNGINIRDVVIEEMFDENRENLEKRVEEKIKQKLEDAGENNEYSSNIDIKKAEEWLVRKIKEYYDNKDLRDEINK